VKAFLNRAIAILSLLSAVASVLLAGQSYVFCPWMQRAAESCCCAHEQATGDAPAVSRPPCCERTTIAAAPGAPTDLSRQAVDVPSASAFGGELIRVLDRVAPSTVARASLVREHGARAGPPAQLFEIHSAYLI
jgi:hypothetical protein